MQALKPVRSALYGPCDLDTEEIKKCVEDAGRAIVAASWLSATARRELSRFKEFMRWLRYGKSSDFSANNLFPNLCTIEITVASSPDDVPHVAPTHDILEVNDYLLTGLHRSQIDRWFEGGAAKFSPQDLGVPDEKQDLATVMKRARLALRDRTSTDLYHVGSRLSEPFFRADRILSFASMLRKEICSPWTGMWTH